MQRFAAALAVCAADATTPSRAKVDSLSFLQSWRSAKDAKGPRHVERYGPGGCVSTWRDGTSGHCIMQTECPDSEDLTVYEFGLLCAGEGGEVTRHVFGQDSFQHQETFDTLIECEECLALDEYMDAGAAVQNLAQQVDTLTQGMKNVTGSIARLEAAVGGPASAPAPAPAAPANFVAQRRPATRAAPKPLAAKHPAAKHLAAKRQAAQKPAVKPATVAKPLAARRAPPPHQTLAHRADRKARKVQRDDDEGADNGSEGEEAQESDQEEESQAGEEDGANYFQQENQNDAGDEEDVSRTDEQDGGASDGEADSGDENA